MSFGLFPFSDTPASVVLRFGGAYDARSSRLTAPFQGFF
jgi:hypothetical protein